MERFIGDLEAGPSAIRRSLPCRYRKCHERPSIELPPHVNAVRVKGRPYYYYQPGRGTKRAAKAVRLPDDPRAPEFWTAYRKAAGEPEPRAKPKNFANLIAAYRANPEWEQLSASTKEGWSIYHRRIEAYWGDLEVRGVEAPHVCALRDKFAKQPATANATLRCLSSLLSWSIPRGWRKDNPCEHVPKLRGGDPYEAWPIEMVQVAEAELRRDLWWAAGLALYSGQRQEDCLVMRWDSISDGVMSVIQGKTGKRVWVPVHRELHKLLVKDSQARRDDPDEHRRHALDDAWLQGELAQEPAKRRSAKAATSFMG